VAVVSRSYGRQFFGDESPIGRTLRATRHDIRIVGVVDDTRYRRVDREPAPALYLPLAQDPNTVVCLVVEPQPGMRAAVSGALRGVVAALDPEQPVEGITTIDQIVSQSTADRRFYAVTTAAFGGVALALAIAGVFGVVARTIAERRRELAIRVALGAEPRRLLGRVYSYGLVPAMAGTAIGLVASAVLARTLSSFLFEIAPTDGVSFAAAAAIVLLVTTAACYLPARRTVRLPPMAVLKSE
jgi:putative ABC transport system permease protein